MTPQAETAPGLDYRTLVERLSDVVYAVDLAGRFTYLNTAGLDLFERTWEELTGEHFRTVIAPESLDVALDYFQRGVQTPEVRPFFELRVLRPDDRRIDMEIHAGALYRNGVPVGRQGVGRDISHLKHLQAQVDATSKRLELFQDQQRVAYDLYRSIALMSEQAPADHGRIDKALRTVQHSLEIEAAKAFGLNEHDLRIVRLISEGCSNREIAPTRST
ncbi:PAS domain S-box protein [Streptomyces sp. NPDC019990]|uniref:PAS domain-containing protein n=1 Tax=Streptomyces sp. NPDC019990 TaxID=3154693 RepID=UPI0033FB6478